MKNPSDVISGIILLFLCAFGAFSTMQLPKGVEMVGPAAVPLAALILMAGGALVLLVRGFSVTGPRTIWDQRVALCKTGLYLLCFLLYLVVLANAGQFIYDLEGFPISHSVVFSVSTVAFLIFSLRFLGRKNKVEIALVSCGVTALLVWIFSFFFKVLLP